jgi:hypothetical protein
MLDASLVIGLATRGRPDLALRTIVATTANIADERTRLLVFVDEDDLATRTAMGSINDARVVPVIRPRPLTVADKWNQMLELPADAYLIMVDHSPHLTPGFDRVLLDAAALFEGGPGVVLGPQANMSFHCANAITRAWADAVGYLYPPYFPYWFTDHWVEDVAKMAGLTELVGISVDSSAKPFTSELREPAWWATWFDVARSLREADARKVLGLAENTTQLRRAAALMHHRSVMINNTVRMQSAALSQMSRLSICDERYQRAKERALEMLPALLDTLNPVERAAAEAILYPPTRIGAIPQRFPTREERAKPATNA